MQSSLEDHLGDIIRKARMMHGIARAAAAVAAGLTEPELAVLEETGAAPAGLNLGALADALGLDPTKLKAIADGWVPAQRELSTWRNLERIRTASGSNTVNSYLIWDESASVAALFDPGWQAEPAIDVLQRNRLELKYIFVTHSHRDHVAALGRIRASFPLAQVYSWPGLRYPAQARGASPVIMLGRLKISTRLTPGHAEDAVTYIIENWPGDPPAVAIVGDALFAGSIGWGFSSWTQARQSVREQILTLPDETLICPGHGPVTTVGEEKRSNPFF